MTQGYVPGSQQSAPPDALRAKVEAALSRTWRSATRPDTGLSPAHRYIAELSGGLRVFVKAATNAETAAWLHNEHLALCHAPPRIAPAILAWLDDEGFPALVTECLAGHWPASHAGVTWRDGDLEQVIMALRRLAAVAAPRVLNRELAPPTRLWRSFVESPEGFLGIGLCSRGWLHAHGAALAHAEEHLVQSGSAFVHGDVRSDNVCMLDDGPRFVDWSNARCGAADTDLAAFLPTAHLEGGPAPYEIFPTGGAWGAAQSADLARRAIADTNAPPWLRRVFRRLAAINLDWAVAGLGLGKRDGAIADI